MTNKKYLHLLAALTLAINLSSCTVGGYPIRMKSLQKPASGYQAVKFKQFTTVRDHAINVFTFTAGTVLINDREMDGVPFYCGLHVINSTSFDSCFVFEGDTIVIGYGSIKEVRRDLSGKITHIRVNP